MFACLTLCNSLIIDAIIMCTEHWGDLVHKVDEAASMCKIVALLIKLYSPFPKYACLFVSPLGVAEYSHGHMTKKKAPVTT